jgi:sterol 3beta-glucosyltransferase
MPVSPGRIRLGRSLTPGPAPSLYIYSPALLPKPADWPADSHVVGPLLLRRQQAPQTNGVGLPADLQAYLDAATRAHLPVVYIGLGSMLGTVFEPGEVSGHPCFEVAAAYLGQMSTFS